jgi:hypothetical protein
MLFERNLSLKADERRVFLTKREIGKNFFIIDDIGFLKILCLESFPNIQNW